MPILLDTLRWFFEAAGEFGLLTFLRKGSWYGSGVWLLRASGWNLARAAVTVAVLLCAMRRCCFGSIKKSRILL